MKLTPSQEVLGNGEEISFSITELPPHKEGGTYIVQWTIEPAGSLQAVAVRGRVVVSHDESRLYSIHSARRPSQINEKFTVQSAERRVSVTADVRYSSARVQPRDAEAVYGSEDTHAVASESVQLNPSGRPPSDNGNGVDGGDGQPSPSEGERRGDVRAVVATMQRAAVSPTPSQALWTLIRQSTNALSFPNYYAFMEQILCGGNPHGSPPFPPPRELSQLPWRLPFPGVEPYRQLKAATEVFVMLNCGVPFDRFMTNDHAPHPFLSPTQQWSGTLLDFDAEIQEEGQRYYRSIGASDIRQAWNQLLDQGQAREEDQGQAWEEDRPGRFRTILYLALVRANLADVQVRRVGLDLSPQAALELDQGAVTCMGILQQKLANPCFIELLWSYWQEEAGLVQTMNAITWRFQNRHSPGDRDPLASLEIDPLRPLNNFLWGYIQDEEHRLSVVRRAYEYAHHYGLTLLGKAVPEIRGADNRSRFIESLHNLLHLCSIFYKEDDDTTVVADGFPLLNALKEVHLLLTQGASNQYGDLPWTARLEMLMQQWLLARPEFREFLPRRVMVDYPEEWMSSVETMKALQGWSSASVLHFRDLAVFGEQIVLSVRFQAWPSVIRADDAANWARYWRPEIQGYIYAYRAVTGVDVTERPDATAPSLLLRQRMQESLPTGRAALARPMPVAQLPMASRLEERSGR